MKVRTTIWIEEDVIKAAKHKVLDQDKSLSEYIEELIIKDAK